MQLLRMLRAVTNGSLPGIAISVSAATTGACNDATQQQLAATFLREVAARTAPQFAASVKLVNSTCTTGSNRRGAAAKAVTAIYSFVVSKVGAVESQSDLQAALQVAVGPAYALGEDVVHSLCMTTELAPD